MESLLFELICRIVQRNQPLLSIAISQRAKFEGWLKFELANDLQCDHDVIVEKWVDRSLVDICVDMRSLIELKTPNTNYMVGNNKPKNNRPITTNVQGIINDIKKLEKRVKQNGYADGYIAFVMFPIDDKMQYHDHIKKVEERLAPNPRIRSRELPMGDFNVFVFVAKVV